MLNIQILYLINISMFLCIFILLFFINKNKKTIKNLKLKIDFLSSDEQKIHNENFVKFLSDSREWAFTYIEEVQTGINNFINNVDREISYFDKYGNIISTPMNKSMEIISKSYKDLKKLVPENDKEQ